MHREKGLFLSVYVDDKKWQSETHVGQIDEMSWSWRTNFSIGTIIFAVYAARLLAKFEKVMQVSEELLESLISAGTIKQLPGWERFRVNTVAWSYDMEGHAKKCVDRHCELANKTVDQIKPGLHSMCKQSSIQR